MSAFAVLGVAGIVLALPAVMNRGGAAQAEAYPAPAPPWRETSDGRLAKKIVELDPTLDMKAVWRCERAACGFDGRFMVLGAPGVTPIQTPTEPERLQRLLSAVSKPIEGDLAWAEYPDSQAQAFRMATLGVVYVFVQSDRRPGGAASLVSDAAIEKVAQAMMGERYAMTRAGAPSSTPAPKPTRPKLNTPATLGPTPTLPEEPSSQAGTPSWR
ncbi:MAG: hypothetical protein IPL88_08515 [Rhizobiales bacterium]|nr:hypothetical protein [Hyphomicrobiales bacterium]